MQPEEPWSTADFVNRDFETTSWRPGYDQDEVDHFLDRCIAQLRIHRGEPPAASSQDVIDSLRADAEDRSRGWFARRASKWVLKTLEAGASSTTPPDTRPITSAEVAAHVFTMTKRGGGYDRDDVDAVLDRMAAALAEHERVEPPERRWRPAR